jgi:hypothetical protein
MAYFRELPDLEYQSPFSDRNSSLDYVRAKNIFRRVKIRDDLQKVFTIFNKYTISDGARPDTVAEALYGKSEFDWVVLISAGIINVRDEWPLSNYDLYNYSYEKYGDNLNDTKFYETIEVRDPDGRLVLPAGKVVDANFTIPDPANKVQNLQQSKVVVAINNYEYEVRKNEAKRNIYVLKPEYLPSFLTDIRKIMTYTESSQFIDSKLIKASNTRIKSP